MATPIESEVREVLTPDREEKVYRCYARAMDDWMGSLERPKLSRWQRTRAVNIFEYLTNHLLDEFSADPGAKFIWHTETFKLNLDQKVLIRFKKAGRNGVGSNIQTQTEMNFCDPQTEIPGLPSLQKVEVDYTINVTGTAIAEINVVARNGDKSLWSYPINGSEGGAAIVPLNPPKPPAPSVDDMVKVRKPEKDELKKDEYGKGE